MSLLSKILGDPNKKILNRLQGHVDAINDKESEYLEMSDSDLKNRSQDLKLQASNSQDIDSVLEEAFALVRETSKRLIGLRHFDVQLMGGIVLHQGKISEMKTGEGKTLVATLPTYLNSILDTSVHVITVNDYLAKRDAEWMGPIYSFLGQTVGCLQSEKSFLFEYDQNLNRGEMIESDRKTVYECDILYGTNNEFGFDYLRDNMILDVEKQVQKQLSFAIVDEVDNILIDEARTPLIISGPARDRSQEYRQYAVLVRSLSRDKDFIIDEKHKNVTLAEEGVSKIENALNVENLYDIENSDTTHFIENALKAEFLFKRDQEYVLNQQQVILVDEFTGRLMQGRRLSDGLHQALEAKENVKILSESVTFATITLQNFFRMYPKLSGMTGTALTEAEEFYKIYKLEVVEVPTNAEIKRKDVSDLIFKNEKSKFSHIVERVSELQKEGSPILIGTTSIEKSETLSKLLRKKNVSHNVLNAKHHEKEAEIIAEAGRPGFVTVATNMAGRGTEIVLGGSEKTLEDWGQAHKNVVNSGGLRVIGTERHESRRIDNQLRGRSGRQGDPGFTQFYISLDDDLMRRFGGDRIKSLMDLVGMEEDVPIENKMLTRAVENAQSKVEGFNFEIRKALVEYDDVMNKQREIIYDIRNKSLKMEHNFKEWELEIKENIHDIFNSYVDEKNEILDKTRLLEDLGRIFNMNPNDVSKNLSKLDGNFSRDEVSEFIDNRIDFFEKENNEQEISEWISSLFLRFIDLHWVEHLTTMDNMRQGIGLQAAGQRDPLLQYKKAGFDMFESLLIRIKKDVSFNIFRFSSLNSGLNNNSSQQNVTRGNSMKKIRLKNDKKIGRNDPCPCGSGLKYKKCFGTPKCSL